MEIKTTPALTFDDVLLEPGMAGFFRTDISLSTRLTKEISLELPFVSAPMDTVTDSRLAIALARLGGIGIIHRNLTVEDQVKEVAKVKAQGLLVGAAVGSADGFEERTARLVDAGTDVLVVDSAHGFSLQVLRAIEKIKANYAIQVIGGNVANEHGASALINAGADALRVGMGPGSICTTRKVSGMGVPQLTAIIETSKIARGFDIPVIADGGIRDTDDMVKAFGAGAETVMFGKLFAATEEACSKLIILNKKQVPSRFKSILNGAKYYYFKEYRGMGSSEAMEEGLRVKTEGEFHNKAFDSKDILVPEGVSGLVPYEGSAEQIVGKWAVGVTSGLYYTGARNVQELNKKAVFRVVTPAAQVESKPHDILVTENDDAHRANKKPSLLSGLFSRKRAA